MKIVWKLGRLWVLGVIAIPAGLFLLNYFITPMIVGERSLEVGCRPCFSQTFDSKIWMESGVIPDGKLGKESPSYGKRYEMVDDVLKTRITLGMEEGQVKTILGNPDGGVVDKKELKALGNQYGIFETNPAKDILSNSNNIAYWSYELAHQWQYPAKSIWFPRMFLNFDRWKLIIKMQNGKVADAKISF